MADDDRPIIIYHGSLEELNSRDSNEQYKFTDKHFFMSKFYDLDNLGWLENIEREVKEKGFAGLVNSRSITTGGTFGSDGSIEGTPILREGRDN